MSTRFTESVTALPVGLNLNTRSSHLVRAR
jgi:hypothetical protein